MKRIVLGVLLLCMLMPLMAQRRDFTELFSDTIPAVYRNGHLHIPVKINGQEMDYIFDTGAANDVVFRVPDKNGLQKLDSATIKDADGVDVNTTTARCELQIGGFMDSIIVRQTDETAKLFTDMGIDGIIGYWWIIGRGFDVKVDLKAGHIIFTNDKRTFAKEKKGKRIHVSVKDDETPHISLRVSPGYKIKNVTLDTGFAGMLKISDAEIEKMQKWSGRSKFMKQLKNERKETSFALGGLSTRQIKVFQLENVHFGGQDYHNYVANTGPGPSLFGSYILTKGSFIFKRYDRGVYFKPYE